MTLPVTGTSGIPYVRVKGVVHGELDPFLPANSIIQDVLLAPRNSRHRVEYKATFTLLFPKEASQRSGFLLYEVVNRGASIVPKDFSSGDIFLSSGWQGDIPFGGKSVYGTEGETIAVPVARNQDGSSITGPILLRFMNMKPGIRSLPIQAAMGYASSGPPPLAFDLDTTHARLTARAFESLSGASDPTKVFSREDWAWGDCSNIPFPGRPDPHFICSREELNPNLLYQVEYTGKDPLVLGVGLGAVRDVMAFFRYSKNDTEGAANPIAGDVQHVVGQGASQAGNTIRTFLNLGFNQDEAGRRVWDAVMPTIAVRQNPINFRFAVPGGASNLYEPGSDGSVWWSDNADPVRGFPVTGLLHRCTQTHTCPKVFEVIGSSEFWSLRATPDFVGTAEDRDLPLPADVRRYYVASTQHGGGAGGFAWQSHAAPVGSSTTRNPIATTGCVMPLNPNPMQEINHALLRDLKEWLRGVEPPPSSYPQLADGTLSEATQRSIKLPFIPGLPSPDGIANPLLVYDFGSDFRAQYLSGFLDELPPHITNVLPAMAPVVDGDGNERAGIHTVLQQAPLGTYLGWNVTAEGYLKGTFCSLYGSYVPFAKTKEERLQSRDSRLSLEERYGTKRGYLCAVKHASDALVKQRLLLPSDAAKLNAEAEHDSNLDEKETPALKTVADRLCGDFAMNTNRVKGTE